MTKRILLSCIFLLSLASPCAQAQENERFSLGFNLGASLPVTIGGTDYSVFPTLGIDFVYRPIPWLGVGASTQENLFIPLQGSGTLVEGAFLPQVLFFIADTGIYAGVRAGFTSIYDAYTSYGNGTSLAWVWGPKVGYQYHFDGSRFALGPEWTMLKVSQSSHTDGAVTVTIPSHTIHNFVLVAKWWF